MPNTINHPHQEVMESPLFVVGPLRSGSTLLRLLLDHHSEVHLFGEFEGAVCEARGNEWPPLSSYHRFVRTDRQTGALNLNVDPALAYGQLVRDFLRQIHLRNPRIIVGASVHSRIDLLPRIWPKARFINLVRDPRDVARSCIGMGWAGNTYEGAYFWEKVERHRKILNAQVPESQRIDIRYEDLVCEPEATLRKICDFLGIGYQAQMLQIERDTSYGFPSARYANQWKRRMADRDVRWVELRLGKQIDELGYTRVVDTQPPLTISERLYIKVQNRLFKAKFHIRRWGLGLWLQQLLARRFRLSAWSDRIREKTNVIDTRYLK